MGAKSYCTTLAFCGISCIVPLEFSTLLIAVTVVTCPFKVKEGTGDLPNLLILSV
jgi:hypothetical protein